MKDNIDALAALAAVLELARSGLTVTDIADLLRLNPIAVRWTLAGAETTIASK